ncbi:hypothetical protein TSTA_062560 [Talaromyces stipitatus ATCC 10500]|uniref:Tetratricopeptide repeat domain protein n=1 Tax=Talaromyces stipitatus (strain ATCC 10500 / CBS 375.48 / QM 6759 / NRRL 1006) TaxID=441959 RepID=B8LXV4_TALSN|nr:uncharacterized protein TSTA_062560 [Talaromyces stipitatus ATCC 10500]EED22769.1 hypothetical protein TSTA_062560 [Talaromyces stipitatus ATCC 10500]
MQVSGEMTECLEVEVVWNHYQHACIHTDLGNFMESLTYFQKALELYKAATNNHRRGLPRLYVIYGGLGNSYSGLRRQVDAEEYYTKCLELKPNSTKFSNYELNICRALYDQGPARYAEASERVEEFIRRREQEYGKEDTRDYLAGQAFYILGNVRICQAEDPSPLITEEQRKLWLNDAYNAHYKSLKCLRATLGEEHHKTADAWMRYAWHLEQRGLDDLAINSLDEALKIFQNASNREYRHAEIARAHYKLSLLFQKKGKNEQAEIALSRAEKIRKTILGDKFHSATGLESYDDLVSHWQL